MNAWYLWRLRCHDPCTTHLPCFLQREYDISHPNKNTPKEKKKQTKKKQNTRDKQAKHKSLLTITEHETKILICTITVTSHNRNSY